jgi:hypothetical protein
VEGVTTRSSDSETLYNPETFFFTSYKKYQPATQHTSLQHNIPACNTTYQPATQHTSLQHSIPACNTTYQPATQHTSLQHNMQACNTTYQPATQHAGLQLPVLMHARVDPSKHINALEYTILMQHAWIPRPFEASPQEHHR